jgi:hypothetical protein
LHAEHRLGGAAGFDPLVPGSGVSMMPPVSVCHQVSTIGQRLPDRLEIPLPGFRVDRLADAAEQAQAFARGALQRPGASRISARRAVGAV